VPAEERRACGDIGVVRRSSRRRHDLQQFGDFGQIRAINIWSEAQGDDDGQTCRRRQVGTLPRKSRRSKGRHWPRISPMSRIVVVLLVLLMPLQVLSAPWRHFLYAPDRIVEHMVEHAEHVPHHHDKDGTIHHGGGGESLGHPTSSVSAPSRNTSPDAIADSLSRSAAAS